MSEAEKCPVIHGSASGGTQNANWWPDRLNLQVLDRDRHAADPMGEGFDYANAFDELDYAAVKSDLHTLMTNSQEW